MIKPQFQLSPALSITEWIGVVVLFSIGAIYQLANPTIADVSWLFVVDEKILSGAQLYRDVIETNPPMSAFLYMPAVMLQHITGLSAEVIQVFLTLGIAACSLILTAAIMIRNGRASDVARFAMATAFVLAILPMFTFSEREHIAVALVLPVLGIIVARADGRAVGPVLCIAAALSAGLAVTIKPHFAAAILFPTIYLSLYRRSFRLLFAVENWVIASVAASYLVIVVVFYRIYLTDILPMLQETYRPVRQTIIYLALDRPFLVTFGAGVATMIIARRNRFQPKIIVPALAAAGFLFAYFEQGKGWPYHLYPTLALIFLLFLTEALPRLGELISGRPQQSSLLITLGVAALVGLIAMVPFFKYRYAVSLPMVERIRATIQHPKVLALSSDLSVGHPLTRMVDGVWVGTFCSQWLSETSELLSGVPGTPPETKARLAAWIARDRDYLAHDISVGRPDIIVVDHKTFEWEELMASGAQVAALLGDYRRIDSVGDVDLLMRSDLIADGLAKINHTQ